MKTRACDGNYHDETPGVHNNTWEDMSSVSVHKHPRLANCAATAAEKKCIGSASESYAYMNYLSF